MYLLESLTDKQGLLDRFSTLYVNKDNYHCLDIQVLVRVEPECLFLQTICLFLHSIEFFVVSNTQDVDDA